MEVSGDILGILILMVSITVNTKKDRTLTVDMMKWVNVEGKMILLL